MKSWVASTRRGTSELQVTGIEENDSQLVINFE